MLRDLENRVVKFDDQKSTSSYFKYTRELYVGQTIRNLFV